MEGVWRDMKKYLCEFLGTCVLVLFGCGVAIVTNADLVATALAFGLSAAVVYYIVGYISGGHINPAVSFAAWIDKRIDTKDFFGYVFAQILGGIAAFALLMLIFDTTATVYTVETAANTFGSLSNSGITMLGALILEIILTFTLVLTVLGITRNNKNTRMVGIVVGLALILVHLFGINLTGTSVNPARGFAPAIFVGGEYLNQAWVFVVGPMVGAAFAALAIFFIDLENDEPKQVVVTEEIVKPVEKKETPRVERKPKPRKAKSAKKLV